ncbi:hypothetical protein PybrP1_006541 [[Pythium] brassicae (nom. inval.)]|nr:hypothetical protein PybrP1_006541 [[Pythium] brassicae (nom. inval.)]
MAARVWHRVLEAAIARALALQDAGHDALLALWSLRLRDARMALPLARGFDMNAHVRANTNTASSSSSSSSGFSVLELLEKFRRGPEDQSEWTLVLWRVTFPLLTLVLLTLAAVAGKFGLAAYSLLVCPAWFLCNFALVVYPFDVVFRFPDLSAWRQRALWRGLAATSLAIAALELYASAPRPRVAWIIGNTLFGVVAFAAIPLFFVAQSRIPREQSSALRDDHGRPPHPPPTPAVTPAPAPVALSPMAAASTMRQRGTDFADADSSDLHVRSHESGNIPVAAAAAAIAPGPTPTPMRRRFAHATLDRPPPANAKSQLVTIAAVCVFAVWLAMFASYSASRSAERAGAAGRYWLLAYLGSPVLCVVLFCTRQHHTNFSIDHVVAYGALVVHIPIFLGHLCLRLFALAEDADSDSASSSSSSSSGASWLKLGVSVLYLLAMQGYFFVITHVVNAMAEPFAHPSLLYIGQLYYYMFWYLLVGSDAPIDALYWGMLLLNNVHIALLNTGIYTDFKRSSAGCAPLSLSVPLGSSVAVCFRASAGAGRSRSDTDDDAATPTQTPTQTPPGSSSGFGATDDDDEPLDVSESDGFLSDPESGEPARAAVKSRRAKQSAAGAVRPSAASRREPSRPGAPAAILSCPTAALLSLRDTCSQGDNDAKRTGSGRRKRAANLSLSAAQRGSVSAPSASSAEYLKPLYFLMKLAEQDNMADTTALILVPSLLTLVAVFEKPSEGLATLYAQANLWLRCVCMFVGRLAGSYLAREIFAYKLRSRLRAVGASAIGGTIDGLSTRLWVQRLMLQDFHRQFWYLTVVTVVVTFACFDRADLPLRYALLT